MGVRHGPPGRLRQAGPTGSQKNFGMKIISATAMVFAQHPRAAATFRAGLRVFC